jgi:hypothetical protein
MLSSIIFDEKLFINSIIYDNNNNINNIFEDILHDKYANEIRFGSEKEKLLYSIYESTFIINIEFEEHHMVQIPSLRNTIFINHMPSLIDILRCKINDELDNAYISDADTDIED